MEHAFSGELGLGEGGAFLEAEAAYGKDAGDVRAGGPTGFGEADAGEFLLVEAESLEIEIGLKEAEAVFEIAINGVAPAPAADGAEVSEREQGIECVPFGSVEGERTAGGIIAEMEDDFANAPATEGGSSQHGQITIAGRFREGEAGGGSKGVELEDVVSGVGLGLEVGFGVECADDAASGGEPIGVILVAAFEPARTFGGFKEVAGREI